MINQEGFTHFDHHGNAIMADISAKNITQRVAKAKGFITLNQATLKAVEEGSIHKGDVLGVARIAGVTASKRTADLIPLCHILLFDSCAIDFDIIKDDGTIRIEAVCTVKLSGKTGAEMEALTGVSVALLTIYDMCKALDKGMVIGGIRLIEKSGGKSGHFVNI